MTICSILFAFSWAYHRASLLLPPTCFPFLLPFGFKSSWRVVFFLTSLRSVELSSLTLPARDLSQKEMHLIGMSWRQNFQPETVPRFVTCLSLCQVFWLLLSTEEKLSLQHLQETLRGCCSAHCLHAPRMVRPITDNGTFGPWHTLVDGANMDAATKAMRLGRMPTRVAKQQRKIERLKVKRDLLRQQRAERKALINVRSCLISSFQKLFDNVETLNNMHIDD